MNKAEVYIAKLTGQMARLREIVKDAKPSSKKRQATTKLVKNQINDYREKLETLGMGTITKTLFQVRTYTDATKEYGAGQTHDDKVYNSLHVNLSEEEVKTLIDYTFKRDNTEILIINQEVAKTGYYEEKQEQKATSSGESGTGRKGRKSKKEA